MEFEYVDSIYVEPSDLREMYLLCKKKGYTPEKAFDEVAMGWDDVDYYRADCIKDQVIKEIEKRIKQALTEKEKSAII